MSLLKPIHWYHSWADLIWPVGPFKVFDILLTFLYSTYEFSALCFSSQKCVVNT